MDAISGKFFHRTIYLSCILCMVLKTSQLKTEASSTVAPYINYNANNTSIPNVISNKSYSATTFIDSGSFTGPFKSSLELTTQISMERTSTISGQESFSFTGPNKKEQESILKALDWLKVKRAPDYGWGNDTHMVILAKELSGAKNLQDLGGNLQIIDELENTLSVKEMEIEILTMLDRHHSLPKPINLEKLARFVLSLGSLCRDPKHFHGHDLVTVLQHHEPTQDIEFALSTLSACSSAAHVRKRQIRRLLDIASGVAEQNVDTIAMV